MGNSPGTGEFPAQMASNAENVSIWWRHHGEQLLLVNVSFQTYAEILTKISKYIFPDYYNLTTWRLHWVIKQCYENKLIERANLRHV